MAYIDIIRGEAATGELAEVYREITAQRGRLSEVLMIQSLHPQSIRDHLNLYMTVMFSKSPLRRAQREMIAVIVSLANNCPYCIAHHSAALHHFWKDEARMVRFQKDFRTADLSAKEVALCAYADQLTRQPGTDPAARAAAVKAAGWEDRALLDTTLIVGYFNFVNRMVLGLGVSLEGDSGGGYRYD
ncbi:MAG: peroxidase-related enzyme [Bacteroidota bacterium]